MTDTEITVRTASTYDLRDLVARGVAELCRRGVNETPLGDTEISLIRALCSQS